MNTSTLIVFIIIALVVFTIMLFYQIKGREKPKREIVRTRTGSLGTGKSYLSVADICWDYRKLKFLYRHRKWLLFRIVRPWRVDKPPRVYSNIPLRLNRKEWAYVLTREHMLCQSLFPEDVIALVLWDEVGLSCNQYSYNDPNIVSRNVNENYECVEIFIRLFRHFYGDRNDNVRLYCTDQASGDICIAIRRRFGTLYCLSDFHRWLFFTPFYKVNVSPLMVQEDEVQNTNNINNNEEESSRYFFGFFPYRWMNIKHYDSHCYRPAKELGFVSSVPFDNWSENPLGFMTTYCPDLRTTHSELTQYVKRNKVQV